MTYVSHLFNHTDCSWDLHDGFRAVESRKLKTSNRRGMKSKPTNKLDKSALDLAMILQADLPQLQFNELRKVIATIQHKSRVAGLREAAERLRYIGFPGQAKRIDTYAGAVEFEYQYPEE